MAGRGPWPFGWWARLSPDAYERAAGKPAESTITYADGFEYVARDRKGRVTRHLVARSGRPYHDRCYRFEHRDGEEVRVPISLEEWEEERRPKTPKRGAGSQPRDGARRRKPRGNAAGVDENDWDMS